MLNMGKVLDENSTWNIVNNPPKTELIWKDIYYIMINRKLPLRDVNDNVEKSSVYEVAVITDDDGWHGRSDCFILESQTFVSYHEAVNECKNLCIEDYKRWYIDEPKTFGEFYCVNDAIYDLRHLSNTGDKMTHFRFLKKAVEALGWDASKLSMEKLSHYSNLVLEELEKISDGHYKLDTDDSTWEWSQTVENTGDASDASDDYQINTNWGDIYSVIIEKKGNNIFLTIGCECDSHDMRIIAGTGNQTRIAYKNMREATISAEEICNKDFVENYVERVDNL